MAKKIIQIRLEPDVEKRVRKYKEANPWNLSLTKIVNKLVRDQLDQVGAPKTHDAVSS